MTSNTEAGIRSYEAGMANCRFKVSNLHCANGLVVGTTLAAIKKILKGVRQVDYADQIYAMILSALRVDHDVAEAASRRVLYPFREIRPPELASTKKIGTRCDRMDRPRTDHWR